MRTRLLLGARLGEELYAGGRATPDPRASCAGTSLSHQMTRWRLCPGRAGWEGRSWSKAMGEEKMPPSEGLAWWVGGSLGDRTLWRGQWQQGTGGSGPLHLTRQQPAQSAGRLGGVGTRRGLRTVSARCLLTFC